jgi:hypothetical protein
MENKIIDTKSPVGTDIISGNNMETYGNTEPSKQSALVSQFSPCWGRNKCSVCSSSLFNSFRGHHRFG